MLPVLKTFLEQEKAFFLSLLKKVFPLFFQKRKKKKHFGGKREVFVEKGNSQEDAVHSTRHKTLGASEV
jgi:hypothetical protein